MNPSSGSDDGGPRTSSAAKAPNLTLDTSSANSTPPLQREPGDLVEQLNKHNHEQNHNIIIDDRHLSDSVLLGNLSLAEAAAAAAAMGSNTTSTTTRAVNIPTSIRRQPSSSSLSIGGYHTPYSLANITPLPSPAGSVSGSPPPRKGPSLHHIFGAGSPQLRPERLSPGLSPTRLPALRHIPSNGSLNNSLHAVGGAVGGGHKRSRSRSDYHSPSLVKPAWQRVIVSGSQTPTLAIAPSPGMQREEFLANKRGLITPLPDHPHHDAGQSSESSVSHGGTTDTSLSDDDFGPHSSSAAAAAAASTLDPAAAGAGGERYEAQSVRSGKTHSWRALRELGTGTFSKVMLAAREPLEGPAIEDKLPRVSLVAVKICEHGPAGGADQRKIEVSLKRELDILRCIDHPSLIDLKAVSVTDTRSYLVLNYCPGGDLFEVADSRQGVLTPGFVHRVFTELVGAVDYLHAQMIVHRDIKLENVLVNVPPIELQQIESYETYPHSIVTLTDLGLGRFIPKPPESVMLTTRCGSEDYAAPELLMGQEYDGRLVDAWALGVLLYAMVEARLPFDPIPGMRRQSPKTHRIARCDWAWVLRGDDDFEWDDAKGKGFEGARVCVENLLTKVKNRWTVAKLRANDWVKSGIRVEGGLSQHTVL